jgi:hypothetical protein
VEKLFEAQIPAKTLMDRAYRQKSKLSGNQDTSPTTKFNSQITEIQVSEHGGARAGAGRPAKYAASPPQNNYCGQAWWDFWWDLKNEGLGLIA